MQAALSAERLLVEVEDHFVLPSDQLSAQLAITLRESSAALTRHLMPLLLSSGGEITLDDEPNEYYLRVGVAEGLII